MGIQVVVVGGVVVFVLGEEKVEFGVGEGVDGDWLRELMLRATLGRSWCCSEA
jgi:hypothetical protein